MKSAYNGQMPYTNYTHDFTGIIDYVFYSASFLTPIRLLGPIGEVSLRLLRLPCASACRPATSDMLGLGASRNVIKWLTLGRPLLCQQNIMKNFDGCPNPHFASDHFSLSTELVLSSWGA